MRKAKDSRDIGVGAGALPNFGLACGAGLSADFAALGHWDYHAAARHVRRLPFGRNSLRTNYGLVLTEGRGTGSTKYALLAALAGEHGRPVELRLSIYEMNADNTPGVGPVLRRCGLDLVPEAHCYLACRGVRVDLTRVATTDPIEGFLYEETIGPAGIDAYKVDVHPMGRTGMGGGARAGLRVRVAGQGRVHGCTLGIGRRMIRKGTMR